WHMPQVTQDAADSASKPGAALDPGSMSALRELMRGAVSSGAAHAASGPGPFGLRLDELVRRLSRPHRLHGDRDGPDRAAVRRRPGRRLPDRDPRLTRQDRKSGPSCHRAYLQEAIVHPSITLRYLYVTLMCSP